MLTRIRLLKYKLDPDPTVTKITLSFRLQFWPINFAMRGRFTGVLHVQTESTSQLCRHKAHLFRFWTHMYGNGIGSLNVYVRGANTGDRKIWGLTGDAGIGLKRKIKVCQYEYYINKKIV